VKGLVAESAVENPFGAFLFKVNSGLSMLRPVFYWTSPDEPVNVPEGSRLSTPFSGRLIKLKPVPGLRPCKPLPQQSKESLVFGKGRGSFLTELL